jgi:hypothetical protein
MQIEQERLFFRYWMLRRLSEGEQFEVRILQKDGKARQTFSTDVAEVHRTVNEANKAGETVYYGVAGRNGGKGGKEGIKRVSELWVDMDFKDLNPDETEARIEADGIIATFDLPVSMVMDSGGGYHVYWFLAEPTEDLARAERILRGLATRLKGDPKVAQVAAVLRPPITKNYKYNPPRKVSIRDFDPEVLYTLDDFKEWEEVQAPPPPPEWPAEGGAMNPGFNVGAYLIKYKIPSLGTKKIGDATAYILRECPWKENHTTPSTKGEAMIVQQPSGLLAVQCFHKSCAAQTWGTFRQKTSADDNLAEFVKKDKPASQKPQRDVKAIVVKYLDRCTGQWNVKDLMAYCAIKHDEQDAMWEVIDKAKAEKKIAETGYQNWTYRPVDTDTHEYKLVGGPKKRTIDIILPFNLHFFVKIHPHVVLFIAGEKDAGKSAFALFIAYMNRNGALPVRLISSEMGQDEMEDRVLLQKEHDFAEWNKITFVEQAASFVDYIDPDGFNIIDYFEVMGEAYNAKNDIRRCYDKLRKGILVICMQKYPDKENPFGGAGVLEKTRMAIELKYRDDDNICAIKVAKNWIGTRTFTSRDGNNCSPKGFETKYKLTQGSVIIQDKRGWYHAASEAQLARDLKLAERKAARDAEKEGKIDYKNEAAHERKRLAEDEKRAKEQAKWKEEDAGTDRHDAALALTAAAAKDGEENGTQEKLIA